MAPSKRYRTFNNDTTKFDLDSDFILAIIHYDGFSERLLHFEVFIDKNFNFYCLLDSFKGSILNSNEAFKLELTSILPDNIKEQVAHLLLQNLGDINEKYTFENLAITDIGSQLILVNNSNETINISIEGELKNYNLNKNERVLEKVISDVRVWIENLYEKIT